MSRPAKENRSTTTLAMGLAASVTELNTLAKRHESAHVVVQVDARPGEAAPGYENEDVERLLASLPGASNVTTNARVPATTIGFADVDTWFIRGDSSDMGFTEQLVHGRWLDDADDAVVTSSFMTRNDIELGDVLTVQWEGRSTTVTVVGAIVGSANQVVYADWDTMDRLGVDSGQFDAGMRYEVRLDPGTTTEEYVAAVTEADPNLYAESMDQTSSYTVTIIGLSTALTIMLGASAALGVFNTVVLNTRERRRDLGMLKSIGMTPRQVVTMTVSSMTTLGVLGGVIGLCLGVLAHRLIVPVAAAAARSRFRRHSWTHGTHRR